MKSIIFPQMPVTSGVNQEEVEVNLMTMGLDLVELIRMAVDLDQEKVEVILMAMSLDLVGPICMTVDLDQVEVEEVMSI
jgi:hypothetical protein